MYRQKFSLFIIFLIFYFGQALSHVGLDYPMGGESFQAGDLVNIQWHVMVYHGPGNWDLYFSIDNGSSWETLAMNLPQNQEYYNWTVPNMSSSNARIQIVQDNQTGMDYTDESGPFSINGTTGIGETGALPQNFYLIPAYPNPFNGSTVISFYLPERTRMEVDIFNTLGEAIQLFVDREFPAGTHQIRWDAAGFPSGIYLYQVTLPTIRKTGKLILMK
jgi:hypothetical protein